jgi:hypothetical protein
MVVFKKKNNKQPVKNKKAPGNRCLGPQPKTFLLSAMVNVSPGKNKSAPKKHAGYHAS